jgi:hypothetical protein
MMAFFGSVKILLKAILSRGSKKATTGKRPINSGINPKERKSCGDTL